LELVAIVGAVAVLFALKTHPPAGPSRVDWRQLTVEGFGAGTTIEELKAHLGPPTAIEQRKSTWHPERHVFVGFCQDSAGYHLYGSRLSLGDRVIATGQDTDRESVEASLTGDLLDLIGPGESIGTTYKSLGIRAQQPFGEPGILYRDALVQRSVGHQLIIHVEAFPALDRKHIQEFELFWPTSRR